MLERSAVRARQRIRLLESRGGVGNQLRAAQLRMVLAEIKHEQDRLWRDGVADNMARGRKAAEKAADKAADALERWALANLPDGPSRALTDGLRAAARSGIQSDAARLPRELSERIYKNNALAKGRVEEAIRTGLIQGLSARELAQDVYRLISPTAPGGVSYNAMRLSRTEINNAFHERQKQRATSPLVESASWNLSGSHPTRDVCNDLAERDNGMGAGRYAADNVPGKPHPHCFCYLTYNMISVSKLMERHS